MPVATDALIPLRGGYAVPVDVMAWLIDSEFRGLRFTVDTTGRLCVSPERAITPEDDKFIRRHRDQIRSCVEYCARLCEAPL